MSTSPSNDAAADTLNAGSKEPGGTAQRPSVAPEVLAGLTAQVPSRLLKRLDSSPKMAEGWTWTAQGAEWQVLTDTQETVTLRPVRGRISAAEQATCSCLLAPRCLHLLASLSLLEVSAEAEAEAAGGQGGDLSSADASAGSAPKAVGGAGAGVEVPSTSAPAVTAAPASPTFDLNITAEQLRALRMVWSSGVALLQAGAHGAGAVVQAGVLRAVHEARAVGLHRLATTGIRLIQQVKMLRTEAAAFRLERLQGALFELLDVADTLLRVHSGRLVLSSREELLGLLGRARREYAPVGNLRLHGLFSMPVISYAGYAGVVTVLVDEGGRFWSVSNVYPGEASRARAALDAAAGLGELHVSHRQLGRSVVFVQAATGSQDGRIGTGGGVQAALGAANRWTDSPLESLWRIPLETQVARAFAAQARGESERRVGDDLLFLEGDVLGPSPQGLLIRLTGRDGADAVVEARYPSDAESLRYLEAFQVLASAPGQRLRWVGQLEPRAPRALQLLAIGEAPKPAVHAEVSDTSAPATGVGRMQLPEGLSGRLSLGLEVLERGFLPGRPTQLPIRGLVDWPDPLVAVRRWLGRVVMGGRDSLPLTALPLLEQEAQQFTRQLMPSGAQALRGLMQARTPAATPASTPASTPAPTHARQPDGMHASLVSDADGLAHAWLVLARYELGAWGRILQGMWSQSA